MEPDIVASMCDRKHSLQELILFSTTEGAERAGSCPLRRCHDSPQGTKGNRVLLLVCSHQNWRFLHVCSRTGGNQYSRSSRKFRLSKESNDERKEGGEEKRKGKREEKEEGRRKGSVIEDYSFISGLNNHTKLY